MRGMLMAAAATLAGCAALQAEVPSAYLAPEWRLLALDGAGSGAVEVTIDLSVAGRVAGQAPCNRYGGAYAGTLPDFRPGPMAATRMACDHLALESTFFAALAKVTAAVVAGDRLILTGPGARLEFVRPQN
jgi:heat shock protein HslJ